MTFVRKQRGDISCLSSRPYSLVSRVSCLFSALSLPASSHPNFLHVVSLVTDCSLYVMEGVSIHVCVCGEGGGVDYTTNAIANVSLQYANNCMCCLRYLVIIATFFCGRLYMTRRPPDDSSAAPSSLCGRELTHRRPLGCCLSSLRWKRCCYLHSTQCRLLVKWRQHVYHIAQSLCVGFNIQTIHL